MYSEDSVFPVAPDGRLVPCFEPLDVLRKITDRADDYLVMRLWADNIPRVQYQTYSGKTRWRNGACGMQQSAVSFFHRLPQFIKVRRIKGDHRNVALYGTPKNLAGPFRAYLDALYPCQNAPSTPQTATRTRTRSRGST